MRQFQSRPTAPIDCLFDSHWPPWTDEAGLLSDIFAGRSHSVAARLGRSGDREALVVLEPSCIRTCLPIPGARSPVSSGTRPCPTKMEKLSAVRNPVGLVTFRDSASSRSARTTSTFPGVRDHPDSWRTHFAFHEQSKWNPHSDLVRSGRAEKPTRIVAVLAAASARKNRLSAGSFSQAPPQYPFPYRRCPPRPRSGRGRDGGCAGGCTRPRDDP